MSCSAEQLSRTEEVHPTLPYLVLLLRITGSVYYITHPYFPTELKMLRISTTSLLPSRCTTTDNPYYAISSLAASSILSRSFLGIVAPSCVRIPLLWKLGFLIPFLRCGFVDIAPFVSIGRCHGLSNCSSHYSKYSVTSKFRGTYTLLRCLAASLVLLAILQGRCTQRFLLQLQ